ncbi:MAG: DUF4476 domain-containing protein [Bacteroidetes bacterium]|nr:DUF4476 domain-containing protein [Bacteroidota bacterium]
MYFYFSGNSRFLRVIFATEDQIWIDMPFLKIIVTVFFSFILKMGVQAQQLRFIYLQSDDKSPFFVKVDGKYLSSSENGYIIIPRLHESTYNLVIGTAGDKLASQEVSISTKDANTGYLIQKNGTKNFELVSLNTLQPVKAVVQTDSPKPVKIIKNEDEFAKVLAQVVGDSSILLVEAENKPAVFKNVDKVDSAVTAFNNSKKENESAIVYNEIKNKLNAEADTFKEVTHKVDSNKISRIKYDSMVVGFKMMYVDAASNDTIDILLPVKNSIVSGSSENKSTSTVKEEKQDTSPNQDARFLDMKLQNPNASPDRVTTQNNDFVIFDKKTENNQLPGSKDDFEKKLKNNSGCKSIATQKGFLKLRSQMSSAKSESEMTKIAISTFASTCFTTEQIKNLGVLYLVEEERYKFYVAAYPYVTDLDNFITLQNQLTDSYFKERFKAMVNH